MENNSSAHLLNDSTTPSLNPEIPKEDLPLRICTETDLEERAKFSSKEDLIRLLDLSNENYRLLKQYVSLRERSNFFY